MAAGRRRCGWFRAVACRADEEGYAFKRRKYIGKGGKVISLPMIYDVRCWKCVSAARSDGRLFCQMLDKAPFFVVSDKAPF